MLKSAVISLSQKGEKKPTKLQFQSIVIQKINFNSNQYGWSFVYKILWLQLGMLPVKLFLFIANAVYLDVISRTKNKGFL